MTKDHESVVPFSRVAIIGLGYIGLPTAATLAIRKISVIGVDINQQTIDTINRGKVHIIEPDLDIVVRAAVSAGYLRATPTPEAADAFLITVPTPFKKGWQPDLRYVEAACKSIAPVIKKNDLIILESTSPVGTTEQITAWFAKLRPDLTFPQLHGEESDIRVAYCPERVLPGCILRELIQNDRIIGGITAACSRRAVQLYKLFVEGQCLVTNARTAEMCKLAENSFRDVNIAFANEMSMICDELDIHVGDLIKLANHHPRVNILQPGPGVGGHCIAVDPWFIVSSAPKQARLIKTARQVNDTKPQWVVEKVKSYLLELLQKNPKKLEKNITIACFGLSFKANIDDLRASPALKITKEISTRHQGRILVVEPNITTLPKELMGLAELSSMEQALEEADIVLLLVAHKSFLGISDKITEKHTFINLCE